MSRADRVTLRNRFKAGELKSKAGRARWAEHPLNKGRRQRHNQIVKQQRR